jgi:hypothetical protein
MREGAAALRAEMATARSSWIEVETPWTAGSLEEFRSGGAENTLGNALRCVRARSEAARLRSFQCLRRRYRSSGSASSPGWVAGGESMAFDRRGILALRNLANLGEPLGPPRLQKAQDVTSLGSIVVVTITTLAVVGYLLPSRERAEALWRSPCSAARSAFTAVALAAILTVLIGMSRVYPGVHYPTHVLRGWCVGAAWALAGEGSDRSGRQFAFSPSFCNSALFCR